MTIREDRFFENNVSKKDKETVARITRDIEPGGGINNLGDYFVGLDFGRDEREQQAKEACKLRRERREAKKK